MRSDEMSEVLRGTISTEPLHTGRSRTDLHEQLPILRIHPRQFIGALDNSSYAHGLRH